MIWTQIKRLIRIIITGSSNFTQEELVAAKNQIQKEKSVNQQKYLNAVSWVEDRLGETYKKENRMWRNGSVIHNSTDGYKIICTYETEENLLDIKHRLLLVGATPENEYYTFETPTGKFPVVFCWQPRT